MMKTERTIMLARARSKKWRLEHREQFNAIQARYRKDHREEIRERARLRGLIHPTYQAPIAFRYNRTFNGKFKNLKQETKKREVPFSLSFQEYVSIVKDAVCKYCGGALPEMGGGLDRVDNDRGYEIGNVVPCCKTCNLMKRNLSESQFYAHMRLILERVK